MSKGLLTDILHKPVRLYFMGNKILTVPFYTILIVIGLVVTGIFIKRILLRDEWSTLNVEEYGISIEHPAYWSDKTYGTGGGRGENLGYLCAESGSTELYTYIHQTEMDNPDITDAVIWGQEIIHGWDATDISLPVETRIGQGNYPAMTQTYLKRHWSETKKISAFYIVTDNNAYMIEFFRVTEKSEPVMQQMLDSFLLYDEGSN